MTETIEYKGVIHVVMDLDAAELEKDRIIEMGGENVCILDCAYHGGTRDKYFVAEVERPIGT